MKQVKVAIVGAGGQGRGYAAYVQAHPSDAKVVAVADPNTVRRERVAQANDVPPENRFTDWRELAEKPSLVDAVVISTQDRMHIEPTLAFAAAGRHIMLEKPMAPTIEECRQIVKAVKDAGIVFAVGHGMRYGPYWRRMKKVIDSGAIGEIVTVTHLEPVGYWHQAHSFVRGPWRNSKESSFMLLAKSCHDLDILQYIIGKPCVAVSSFGSLKHFKSSQKPEGAAARCTDCSVEKKCPYSAKKIYLTGHTGWPVSSITDHFTSEGIAEAVEKGPYGRCVYECDNDVVDHQVVSLLYEDEVTASFTMTAFTPMIRRRTRVMGTHGEITGDRIGVNVYDFLTDETTVYNTDSVRAPGSHMPGDGGIMKDFIDAVAAGDPSMVSTGPDESLESHAVVFAAEAARLRGTVEKVSDYR